MNTAGVLDDYLEQLLGDAVPAPADAPSPAASLDAGEAPAVVAAPVAMPSAVLDDLLDEVRNDPSLSGLMTLPDTSAGTADDARPDWNDLPPEVVYETDAPVAAAAVEAIAPAPGFDDLLDEVRNDPSLSGAMTLAKDEDRPSWDDLPPEVVYETAPVVAPAAVTAPGFDDLLDEVRNDPSLSGLMTAGEDVAPSAVVLPPAPASPPAPTARTMPAMPLAPSIRAKTPTLAHSRPGSWEELQRQARDPASSPRENRRASERTSRWLRLRCGAQAYALELLKVQEVVLPVPLLPLRGTAPEMLGIMNLRGQVVPVMDLGIHLGSSAIINDANTRIVVLEENGETMGLRVSAVEDVANLTDSQIEPPDTARICQISNDLFRGVARVTAQPMILLDATQLLN
ncbi:chemotaxis protein CheW [Stenotrophomonas sp.]|uniref:chemotaxis protein CheW n=1 Tax=Stenotrophomonas sp. TaxID=69392 RepID=UPI00334006C3